MPKVLTISNLRKTFIEDKRVLEVLAGISLEVGEDNRRPGESGLR
jgi:ABC-type dipeptide/oligopeptide/nickel transport system ATPase component